MEAESSGSDNVWAQAWLTEPSTTEDRFETTMAVNHLAHFHLTTLLLPKVLAAADPRVVVLSSSAHAISSVAVMTEPSLGMSGLSFWLHIVALRWK